MLGIATTLYVNGRASKATSGMTDNRTFIAALSALLATVGAMMWFLDSPISNPGAQLAAMEGLYIAVGATIVAATASLARLKSRNTLE